MRLRRCEIWMLVSSLFILSNSYAANQELWNHLTPDFKFSDCRGVSAQFISESTTRTLRITCEKSLNYNWCSILAPDDGWPLSQVQNVEVMVKNTGSTEVKFLLWVVGHKGWNAVPAMATLKPEESTRVSCNLRSTFPDTTPLINPGQISKIQFMLVKPDVGAEISLQNLQTSGIAEKWMVPEGRLEVPDMTSGAPQAGKRVWYQPQNAKGTNCYVVLYLPTNYDANKKHPVIVEFPGNIFFTTGCYSTGRPEQCVIGYGMSKGKDAIWISMPFVQDQLSDIAESGWGNADETADFTVNTVNEIVKKFNGDKEKVIVTGFSRGAIACGYIGLRNDSIASLWKGMHACQHYDGDGWKGASMAGAKERIKRFKGKCFQTDNEGGEPKQMLAAAHVAVTYASSGLGAHATAMFLDNRDSSIQLRRWFKNLVGLEVIPSKK